MTIDQNIRTGVVTSIVGTVAFIYLLDPIMRLIRFLVFRVGSTLFRSYIDHLFEKSALLQTPDSGFALLLMMLMLACSGAITLTMMVFVERYSKMPPQGSEAEIAKRERRRKRRPWLLLALTIILNIVGFAAIYDNMFQLRTISSFNQHVTALAPYLTQQEVNVIRSQWTQMRSEENYKVIYHELNALAERNHIRLPENLAYSITSF